LRKWPNKMCFNRVKLTAESPSCIIMGSISYAGQGWLIKQPAVALI
jgi:hypothetical protein